jgi:hypothetical protein
MKRLVTLIAVLLATGCSHANTNTAAKSDSQKAAPAPMAAPAAPKAKASEVASKASCKHGSDVRDLTIVTKGEGCAVTYTKHGETKELASAEHETQHCKEVLTKVRGHLETAGFSCN